MAGTIKPSKDAQTVSFSLLEAHLFIFIPEIRLTFLWKSSPQQPLISCLPQTILPTCFSATFLWGYLVLQSW